MIPSKAEKLDELIALLESAGHVMTGCPVLVPAETVLDLVGPLTRGRLYLTSGIGGREFCLRPEFTIAIADAHIKSGAPARPAQYGYCGPVFRKRPTGTGEFLQAGAESIGRPDCAEADAEMALLAWKACTVFAVQPKTIFGDQAIFTRILTALDLPPVWHRRLLAAFGDSARLDRTLSILESGLEPGLETGENGARNRFAGLGRLDGAAATAIVEEMIGVSESATIAGRHVDDIAKRLLEKARLVEHAPAMPEKARIIRTYLNIECPLAEAEDGIARFAAANHIDLSGELETFSRRCAIINSAGELPGAVRFQAFFGRQLDYYTGFIFDIFDAAHGRVEPVCGGGRYDGLTERLGAPEAVPAVGFSLWLDRLLGEDAA